MVTAPILLLLVLVLVPLTLIGVGLLCYAMIKLGLGFLQAISAVVGRIVEFVGGVVGDVGRMIGAVLSAVAMGLLTLFSVVIGRWSASGHYAAATRHECGVLVRHAWSVVARRPLRLLFLDSLLEGVEGRVGEAVRRAPGPDAPRGEVRFPGFTVVGSLPAGGSGAKLYIADPDESTRRRIPGCPGQVVIKSFALSEGSSLPQIVRESRSLESARRLGLVLAHQLDQATFWYAMPYHPGDHLGVAVRDTHAADFEDGLRGDRLAEMLGYAIDLVRTLDRYHGEGLWHKDVKPDNIIIHDGSAHLVDFGLVSSLRSAMTLTTHGTEYFRDPEMVRMAMRGVKVHEVNGAKFDVYGAGAVLYFMLENTFPGHGGLSRFERPAPEALRWIVRRAMADYGQRYETAAEMLGDLETVARSSDPWAMTPAMLPSMGGRDVDRSVDGRAAASDTEVVPGGTTSPPPPPPPPPPPHGTRRRTPARIPAAARASGAPASPAMRAGEQVRTARSRAAARRRELRSELAGGRGSTKLVATVSACSLLLLVGLALAATSLLGIGDDHGSGGGRIGPLALEPGWSRTILPGRLDAPEGSARLVILEDHGGLQGIDVEGAVGSLRQALEERGWEIVEDPEVLAASIVAMPRDGMALRGADGLREGRRAFGGLAEVHPLDSVLYVRTRNDGSRAVMELEFWSVGETWLEDLTLIPDVDATSMVTVDRDLVLGVNAASTASRPLRESMRLAA